MLAAGSCTGAEFHIENGEVLLTRRVPCGRVDDNGVGFIAAGWHDPGKKGTNQYTIDVEFKESIGRGQAGGARIDDRGGYITIRERNKLALGRR